jgi:hypothetical protein
MKRRDFSLEHPVRTLVLSIATMSLFCSGPALAERSLSGQWQTLVGTISIREKGGDVVGTLTKAAANVPIKKGTVVLNGARIEDNVTGEITVALTGPDCPATATTMVVLLVAADRNSLSGAVHLPKPACNVPGLSAGRGLRITRVATPAKPKPTMQGLPTKPKGETAAAPAAAPEDETPRGKAAIAARMKQGLQLLQDGHAEQSRRAFLSVIKADPTVVEAYNGVGVTFWRRSQYDEALAWYKKALDLNPDFGDVYYNIACIYSLKQKKPLALRYLKIALLNGYIKNNAVEDLLADDDLANIRDDPEFKLLLSTLPGGPAASAPASAPAAAP